jgi:Cd2+/Zn2+-exporting ATPase
MVRSYRLKDLDCANCAMKIGHAVGALTGVKNAQVHFTAQRLTVEFAGEPALEIETQIRDTVRAIEPETQVYAWQEQSAGDVIREEEVKRKEFNHAFMAVGASLILLAAGIFLKSAWPLGETLLMIAAYLLAGLPVVKAAYLRLRSGQTLDETLLMTIATLGAWALNEGMEAAAVMLFYRVGETLQDMAVLKGRSDIRALSKLVSDTAHVVLREVVDMPTSAVQPGDILEVRTGERIPVDGEIVLGNSALDLSALTGESVPVNCAPGDKVLSGSQNTGALIRILCEKPAAESTVARILRLTREEAAKKAAPERFLGKFAAVYTPAVVAVAALVFLLPPILGLGSFAQWGYRALLLLMISCPCALVLSVPLGYVAGMGDSAHRGLLIKGGAALEALAKVNALALDKTGTLTEGVFRLQAVHPAEGVPMDELMESALFAESKAQHPLARSIVASPEALEWFSSHTLSQKPEAYEEIPGKGVRVKENGHEILCGSHSLLSENGIMVPMEHAADQVHAAENGKYLGSFHLNDALRKEAPAVLAELQRLNIGSVTVLTGDSEKGAQAVKSLSNVSDVRAGLLPEGKVGAVREIAISGLRVAFVGDGINDAPVLAAAHVGIAMGGIGSQAAMEAADCVLAAGTLSALPEGIKTARRTALVVRINVAIALVIKLLVMILGIAGLASMWLAVIADVGVSLLCVLLTGVIRLRRAPRQTQPQT